MTNIPTATDKQIIALSNGIPTRIGPAPKCLDCGRFHAEDQSFCESCRVKHLTTGTPYWKFQEVEV